MKDDLEALVAPPLRTAHDLVRNLHARRLEKPFVSAGADELDRAMAQLVEVQGFIETAIATLRFERDEGPLTDRERAALDFCLNETMVSGHAHVLAEALARRFR